MRPRGDAAAHSRPWSGLPAAYWKTLGLLMVFAFANSSDTLLILRAKNLGLSDVQSILGYTLFNVVYAASAYPLGVLSDRFGRWRMVITGWTLYAAVYFGFALGDMDAVWWLFPLYGLFMGLTEGVDGRLSGTRYGGKKGHGMGIFHMSIGFTMLGRKRHGRTPLGRRRPQGSVRPWGVRGPGGRGAGPVCGRGRPEGA
jgi:MFS family permease